MSVTFDTRDIKPQYPKTAFLIIITEFCERYSYFGVKTILTLYLIQGLKFSADSAMVILHSVIVAVSVTPLLGAIVADSFLGKFKTILYFSIIHALGNIVLALSAIPPLNLPAIPVTIFGLGLMALGTGGIKPCVSSFGGDQFILPEQSKQVVSFFSYFYLAISLGSLASSLLSPVLRSQVQCFGDDTCYSFAFALPAGLMIVALLLFLAGTKWYRKIKPKTNVVLKSFQCVGHALVTKSKSPRPHWLDQADDKYDPKFIEDVKVVWRLLPIYTPVPLFFALYDQMASSWTIQATRMDGVVGSYTIYPDQFMVVNPVMILIFIPLFDRVVFPVLEKCNLLKNPLSRMTFGGVLCAVAFMISGFVELQLQNTYPNELRSDQANLNFINALPCGVTLTLDQTQIQIDPGSSSAFEAVTAGRFYLYNETNQHVSNRRNGIQVKVDDACTTCIRRAFSLPKPIEFSAKKGPQELMEELGKVAEKEGGSFSYMMTFSANNEIELAYGPTSEDRAKAKNGNAKIRILVASQEISETQETMWGVFKSHGVNKYMKVKLVHYKTGWVSDTIQVDQELVKLNLVYKNASGVNTLVEFPTKLEFESGGNYLLTIFQNGDLQLLSSYSMSQHVVTPPNTIHMLWLLPQYVIMTVAELLVVVTGLQFLYSQAPVSMKAVMQALFSLTVAFGNLFVVVITEASFFQTQSNTYFFYAALMFIDGLWFAILAYQYKTSLKL